MWEGGQAGDTLRLLSPVPTHQEPLATPIMAVGLPTWQSQPPRTLVSAAGALRRAWPGRRQRAREGGPGKGWGPEGRRDCWVGPGPPPPAHQELQTTRREPAVPLVLSACWARGSYL